jgi:peptide/nickel transport system substrate-binding protein
VLRRFVPDSAIAGCVIACCFMISGIAPAGARTRPHYGGTLRIELESDPLQRDLLQRPDGLGWRLILDGLTDLDTQGAVRPSLAERWATENNDQRWQFWLRPGVSFQSGRPLNALAVATSLEESCRLIACPWTGIHVVGQSVVFTSENPMPNLPSMLAGTEFLIRQSPDASTSANGLSMVVGTGPFRMKEVSRDKVVLEANDDCWRGRPFVDAVEISSHRPTRDQWMDLSQNKADIVEVRPSDIRQARQQRLNVAISSPQTLLALQVNNTGLASQLRAALAAAVDRAALFQVIFQKEGEVSASLLPSSLSGYSFLFPAERDLSHAQALRGGTTPPQLTLSVDGNGPMQLAAERLALNLHDAGFTVKVIAPGANAQTIRQTDLVLRALPLQSASPAASLEAMLRSIGENKPVVAQDAAAAYQVEHDYLEQHTVIPLLYLPRAWALGDRVRDMGFNASGVPDIAGISLEGGP